MNVWYGAAIVGLVLLLEGLVNLIVNVTKKRGLRSDAIRALSGGTTLLFAFLSIHFKWFGADIVVEYNPFYSFSSAGFVLMLESVFSAIANAVTKRKRESGIDVNRGILGIVIFVIGLIALILTRG